MVLWYFLESREVADSRVWFECISGGDNLERGDLINTEDPTLIWMMLFEGCILAFTILFSILTCTYSETLTSMKRLISVLHTKFEKCH